MRVFLDACIDPKVAVLFPDHEVKTASELGWHRVKDHLLLPMIQDRFDVFVTIDRGFEFEHNVKRLRFGLVIVSVPKNVLEHYRPLQSQLLEAIGQVKPGEVRHV